MKKLALLILHCTATPEGMAVTGEMIRQWHTSPAPPKGNGRGWKQVGYADMIHLNGNVENLVPYNNNDVVEPWEITNGHAGVNSIARHVVYVGGMDKANKKPKDTRTEGQRKSLADYVKKTIAEHPTILVGGHNQFCDKACPSFDVPTWLKSIGIDDKNIYRPQ